MARGQGPNEQLVKLSDDQAQRLTQLYSDAEREVLDLLNKALAKGNSTRHLDNIKGQVQTILQHLNNGGRTWCEQAIPSVYIAASNDADQQLKGAGVAATFGAIHQQAAQVLAESTYNRLQDLTSFIGRRVDDIYRKMALEAVRGSTLGYTSWQQAARKFKTDLAQNGITGFTDKAGKQWNMSTYAKMVARTSTMEAHTEGTKNRLAEYGRDLVMVSHHPGCCDLCAPWEGKVLSLTGKTPGYPTLDDARAAGLFHPNCKHAYGLYVPELHEAGPAPAAATAAPAAPPKQKPAPRFKKVQIQSQPPAQGSKIPQQPVATGLDLSDLDRAAQHKLSEMLQGVDITDRRQMATQLLKNAGINIPVSIRSNINANGYVRSSVSMFDNKVRIVDYNLEKQDARPTQFQTKTALHEWYHALANGLDSGSGVGAWANHKTSTTYEETATECASHYMARQAGITGDILASYSDYLTVNLPRLKQMAEFSDCSSVEDFGAKFLKYRLSDTAKTADWTDLANRMNATTTAPGQDYYGQYEQTVMDNLDTVAQELFDSVTSPGKNQNADGHKAAFKNKVQQEWKTRRGQFYNLSLMWAMQKIGVK